MADTVTTNVDDINKKLAAMSDAMRGQVLETAVRAGALPIEAHAKVIVHKLSGTLSRSIHTGGSGHDGDGYGDIGYGSDHNGQDVIHLLVGTDVEYAIVEEFREGGGHAYMRPAYDAEKETAVQGVAAALREIIRGSL